MKLFRILRSVSLGLLLIGPTGGYADDTDIFFDQGLGCGDINKDGVIGPDESACPEPLVMLSLDLAPASSNPAQCTLYDDCASVLGTRINNKLEELNKLWNLGLSSVTRFDAIRAVYAVLFDDLSGVKVGMMVNHNDPDGSASADLGGAYVLRGFRSFQENDANHAKEELVRKMFSLPQPKQEPGGGGGGGGGGASCTAVISPDKNMTAFGMTFSITDVVVNEGSDAVFTIAGSGTATSAKSLVIQSSNGSSAAVGVATAGTDYTALSTSKNIPKNQSPFPGGGGAIITVTVPTIGDLVSETTEGFKVTLSMAGSADTAVGYGTICDTPAGFSVDDPALVTEGEDVVFTVTRTGPTSSSATVQYLTKDDTAVAGTDYTAHSGTLNFSPGQTSKTVTVATQDDGDTIVENKFFYLVLQNPSAGSLIDDIGRAAIRETSICESNEFGANETHTYQGAQLYFELFRYLTGGKVYSGHNGYEDFTGPADKNLDQECYEPGLTVYDIDGNIVNPDLDADGDKFDNALQWDVGGPKPDDPDNPLVEKDDVYVSPLGPDSECAATYAINMLFGTSVQDNESITDINSSRADGGTGTSVEGGANATTVNAFADMIRFMDGTDLANDTYPNWSGGGAPEDKQTLTSYILRMGGPAGQFAPYAAAGATVLDVAESTMEQLLIQLQEVFRQILSVSATFVSASVPVNVFNRVEFSEDIYIALFNVDDQARPVWPGNVKKLKLGKDSTGNLIVHAVNFPQNSAIASGGRINFNALTYWTEVAALPTPDQVGAVDPPDTDAGDEQQFKVAGADGPFAARGAAGHRIPGYTASTSAPTLGNPGLLNSENKRQLFTQNGSNNGFISLDMTDARATELQASFGAATVAAAKELICFARGVGNCADVIASPASTTPQAHIWIMGDVLHSRPLPLNYGARAGYSKTNPDIRLLVGTNDGYFRMIRNTAASTSCGDTDGNGQIDNGESPCAESGVETWGFMPREVMHIVDELEANTAGISPPHPYGIDGEPVVIVNAGSDIETIDSTVGDTAWVYFGLRRGGSAYYGIDVSDPDSPSLMWVITDKTPGFEELGMTFSTPTPATVDFDGTPRKVLVFGGGYYGGWADLDADGTPDRVGYDSYDASVAPDLTNLKGNAIYMVDAETGELLWKAMDNGGSGTDGGTAKLYDANSGLDDGFAAEVAVVDSNEDDISDRAYVGDLGGNVWRIDIPRNINPDVVSDNRGDWKITRLATLGDVDGDGGADDRRFFHKIDVVFANDPNANPGSFDGLLIGSGDRAHPKVNDVDNQFFVIKDPYMSTVPSSEDPFTVDDFADADCFLLSGAPVSGCDNADTLVANGWRLNLTEPGEKVLASSLTIGGQVFFSSYLPQGGGPLDSKCSTVQLGTGRGYAVNLFNGRPIYNNAADDNGNAAPSTAADRYEDSSWGQGIPTEYQSLGGNVIMGRPGSFGTANIASYYRTFWYEKDVDN